MLNYFEVLNISENADSEVIHFAYKTLVSKYHPDTTKLPKDIAAEKMSAINEAYRVLSDEVERQKYIKSLHEMLKNSCSEDLNDEVRNGTETPTYVDNHSEFYDDDSADVMSYIFWIVIIISVICCMIYFGPEILGDTWNNIVNGFEKVISTFKK